MKELVEFLAKKIVENPLEVSVEEKEENQGKKLLLSVASSDMGKIIGKKGRVIKAIRALLRIKGIKEKQRVYLELAENN